MKYMNPVRQAKMSIQKKMDITGTGKICETIITLKLETKHMKVHNFTSNQHDVFPNHRAT